MSENKKYYMKRLASDLELNGKLIVPGCRKLTATLIRRLDKNSIKVCDVDIHPEDRSKPVQFWPYDEDGNRLPEPDPVNHPPHYKQHPSGIECIQITEHMGFNLGNAVKYIWRADLKGAAIQDLEKAAWYIQREIQKRKASE